MKNELVNKESGLLDDMEDFAELLRRWQILNSPDFKLTDIYWEDENDNRTDNN